jgi:hypothetical protein
VYLIQRGLPIQSHRTNLQISSVKQPKIRARNIIRSQIVQKPSTRFSGPVMTSLTFLARVGPMWGYQSPTLRWAF